MVILVALISVLVVLSGISYLLFTRSIRRVLWAEQSRKILAGQSTQIKNAGSIDRSRKEGWRSVISMKEIRDIAYYEGKLWLATSGGLIAVSPSSKALRIYTRLNGLPDADITSLAVRDNFLYAGSSGGFVMIVKESELSYISLPTECGAVNTLLNTPEGVAIGTAGAGVWMLKGGVLSRVGKDVRGADFLKVTALTISNGNLVVGTYDDGVFVGKADGFAHYTEKEGLPMDHVTSLGYHEGRIYVGTPAGWASINAREGMESHASAFVTSIAEFNGKILAGTHRGIVALNGASIEGESLPKGKISALKNINGALHIIVNDEIFVKRESGWTKIYSASMDAISANHITALLYRDDEVWVGTFENGFDVFDRELKRKKFSQSEGAWAVNGFLAEGDNTVVAHNSGVSIYRENINVKNITTDNGLVGNRVSAVCPIRGGKVYATEGGISFDIGGVLKSIYAFHGLVNNHVYSCASAGDKLYVGTLGGLSVIENLKVVKSFRPGESPLKSGWVSALALLGDDLYVGTYGGGIQKLSKGKGWVSYDEIGNFEVNQGAMLFVDGNLLVGSTDKGLLVLNDSSGEWVFIREGLNSDSVTALAVGGEYVYVGTNGGITLIPRGEISSAVGRH